MKKKALLIALISLLVSPAFSLTEAVITEMVGRVELRQPGGEWEPAAAGMLLREGTAISTGFNASAKLEVGETVIFVKQLTRMQLEELLAREGTQTTKLFLQIGKVQAEIKTVEGLKHDFVMKSPICTAAVRGTVFDFDTIELGTEKGLVVFYNPVGMKITVGPGEKGKSYGGAGLNGASENHDNDANVSSRAGGVKRGVGHLFDDIDRNITGGVVIKWYKAEDLTGDLLVEWGM